MVRFGKILPRRKLRSIICNTKIRDVSNYFECIVAAKGVCFVMKCIGCYYYRSLSQNKYMDDYCCHYLIDTGNMRKIPPSECYRHEGTPYLPKKREPQRWNQ